MKERLLQGWTFIRIVYVLLGSALLIQALADAQWAMALFGAYVSAMGIFRFGCAAGSCVPLYQNTTATLPSNDIPDADYEEVRTT